MAKLEDTRTIQLTQGKVAFVSEEDFESLSSYAWCISSNGYARRGRKVEDGPGAHDILMHRVIMNASIGMDVDHIDNNKLNNVRSNLRVVTPGENRARRTYRHTKGILGVRLRNGKWIATYAKRYLGSFDTPQEAVDAYNKAAYQKYGEFAVLSRLDSL